MAVTVFLRLWQFWVFVSYASMINHVYGPGYLCMGDFVMIYLFMWWMEQVFCLFNVVCVHVVSSTEMLCHHRGSD